MYEALLIVHILAVIITFGVTFTYPVWEIAARKAGARAIPYYLGVNRTLDQRITGPGLAVILLAGIGLILIGGFSFAAPWISAAFLIVIVLGGLTGAFFIPNATKLIELAERDIAAAGTGEVILSEEFERGAKLRARVGGFAGLLVVIALVLMVVKP